MFGVVWGGKWMFGWFGVVNGCFGCLRWEVGVLSGCWGVRDG